MFPLWQKALYTLYVGKGTGTSGDAGTAGGRGPSNAIWARAIGTEMNPTGLDEGFGFFDDFVMFPAVPYNNAVTALVASDAGAWQCLTTNLSGTTIAPVASTAGGVIRASAPITTTSEQYMVAGGGATPAVINDGAGKKLLFECKIKTDAVLDHQGFYGLTSGSNATGLLTAASPALPLGTANFLGFYLNAQTLSFVWQRGSGTAAGTVAALQKNATTLQTAASTAWSKTLTAATFYKIGFVYDPAAKLSERITVYVNGQAVGTLAADVLGSWDATGTTYTANTVFPDKTTYMAPALLHRNNAGGTVAACAVDYDWAGFYQAG